MADYGYKNSDAVGVDGIRLTTKPHAFCGAVLPPEHARGLNPTLCMAMGSALAEIQNPQIPYTLWITEAWRVLGWAEPTAALFWELSTMYHTLIVASRHLDAPNIPPILSCGSTSSFGSGATNSIVSEFDKKKFSSAISAKELPVWLIGSFLLLHCEEFAYNRNLAGQDDRRFFTNPDNASNASSKMDFTSLFKYPSMAPRARLHAGWNHDHTHCTAYLLRHLRKILLLTAIAHNKEATSACELLAAIPPEQLTNKLRVNNNSKIYNTHELRRQHDDEHLDIGLKVKLTVEDLDKLDLVFQPQNGGNIDDPPLKMGEYLWKCLFSVPPPPTASIPLADVEREIRQHLSIELTLNNYENDKEENEDEAVNAMAKLSLKNTMEEKSRLKEMTYSRLRGTTVLLKPSPPDNEGASVNSNEPNFNVGSGKLHDLTISDCSDAHFYLLRPFEQCTIAACNNCTIVVGAVAGLVHIVDCEKTNITATSRRFLISNSCDVQMFVFSPSPPLMVGDNRTCQFAPYNTYYDGLREDLLATGLAAAVLPDHAIRNENDASWPPLQCASNKWKQPIDVSKLEVPQGLGSPTGSPINSAAAPLSPGADDRATSGSDSTLQAPILLPPSEFNILFVPIERHDHEDETKTPADEQENVESHYCRYLAEVLQLLPFRLPIEYERIVLSKAERMKNIQQAVKKHLTAEQQHQFEEELNRGFRDWLVSSGNLRQVLDLVHLANQHQDLSTTQKRGVE